MRHCIIRVSSIQRRLQSFYSFLRCVPQLYPSRRACRVSWTKSNILVSTIHVPRRDWTFPRKDLRFPMRNRISPAWDRTSPTRNQRSSGGDQIPLAGNRTSPRWNRRFPPGNRRSSLLYPRFPGITEASLCLAWQKSPTLPKGTDRQVPSG